MGLVESQPCSKTLTILSQSSKTTHSSRMSSFWRTKIVPVSQRKSSESSKASEVHSISWEVSLNLPSRNPRIPWRTLSLMSWRLRRWETMKSMMILQLISWVLLKEPQRCRISWIWLMVQDLTLSPCVNHQQQMSQRLFSEARASVTICNTINRYVSQHRTSNSNLKCFWSPTRLWCKIRKKIKMECCYTLKAL